MTTTSIVGDWIQATAPVLETMPDGSVLEHARTGAVGHVLDVDGDWATVFWERTGTITDTHVSEYQTLCRADCSVAPIMDRESV